MSSDEDVKGPVIIDEALEQEFPEEKREKIGKNYNETALQEDATVETVIKVSGNKHAEDVKAEKAAEKAEAQKEKEESERVTAATLPPTPPPPPETVVESIIHHSWGHLSAEPKDIPVVHVPPPPPPPPPKDVRASKAKSRERQRREAPVEQEVDRIIDSQDNEYVLSRPKDGALGLTLDPQLMRDLTVLISSSVAGGMLLEAVKQPVINGYFIAGSVVGPGGLQLIKELVQVESLAQMGVQLLLFTLGLEFSLSKLRVVRNVALLGGMVEIFLFIIASGLIAHFIGAGVHEGIFVGALVSMSSTSIVIKCLSDTKSTNTPHGAITIGTLILQDCMVGLLFAFMPVLAGSRGGGGDQLEVVRLLVRVTFTLAVGLAAAMAVARTALPPALRVLSRHASPELYQLTLIAFCLLCGWLSGFMGLSTELGAFVAGVMLSATDQQEHCLAQLEHLKQFFLSLFVSSIGLVISPTFLAQHLRVLAGGLVLTIACKTILISAVVWMFSYPLRTALAVGLSMAQIGEFAFVLLSVASHQGLLAYQVYMLLMGITGMSLLVTPFLMQACRHILPDAEGSPVQAWNGKAKLPRRSSSEDLEAPLTDSGAGSPSSSGRLERRAATALAGGGAYLSEVQLNQRVPFL
ncbi:hypothetical protein WJX81_000500 [Elliptochloris bilobata]|uniref:Cation/H+ exchanger transmembrane domain-containing protein n=1 Tax=Elliptochloris bilobata TaxID=381761 RepID=A0AAW1RJV0_9CHLO